MAIWRFIAHPHLPVEIWHGRTCASAWSALLHTARAAEQRHIVAGVRFH